MNSSTVHLYLKENGRRIQRQPLIPFATSSSLPFKPLHGSVHLPAYLVTVLIPSFAKRHLTSASSIHPHWFRFFDLLSILYIVIPHLPRHLLGQYKRLVVSSTKENVGRVENRIFLITLIYPTFLFFSREGGALTIQYITNFNTHAALLGTIIWSVKNQRRNLASDSFVLLIQCRWPCKCLDHFIYTHWVTRITARLVAIALRRTKERLYLISHSSY